MIDLTASCFMVKRSLRVLISQPSQRQLGLLSVFTVNFKQSLHRFSLSLQPSLLHFAMIISQDVQLTNLGYNHGYLHHNEN